MLQTIILEYDYKFSIYLIFSIAYYCDT